MPPLVRTIVVTALFTACCQSPTLAQTIAVDDSSASVPSSPAPAPSVGLRLSPRTASGTEAQTSVPSGLPSIVTVFGSLGAVLAAFFVLAWLMKRGMPKNMGMLPPEVVEVLGRAPLAQRQFVHLMRCGNKLLLVSVSAAGAETLSEITDPIEVDRLTGICAQRRGDSVTASFRQVLHQFGRSKAADDAELTDLASENGALDSPHSRSAVREGSHV